MQRVWGVAGPLALERKVAGMPFTERTVTSIDEIVEGDALAVHPFLVRWSSGDLTRDDLRAFATQFHHHVDSFGRFVSTVHANAADAGVRRVLLGLLNDIEGRQPNIAELWLQTCAALGLFSDSVRESTCTSSTEACMNDFFYLCQGSTVSGLAAVYAFVRQLPALCRLQRDGLKQHYGMPSGPGLEFFEVASYLATSQAQLLRSALKRAISDESSRRDATGAASASMVALRGMVAGAIAVPATR